jgi:hypothetical protein
VLLSQTYLLGWLDGDGVLLWDGDRHWFGGVVLVALEGSSELFGRSAVGIVYGQTPVGRRLALLSSTMDATHLDHGRTLGSTSESGCGAGGLRRRNKQWRLWVEPRSQGLHCAVCSMSYEPPYSTLSGARARVRVGEWEEWCFPLCDDRLAVVDGRSRG